MIKNITICFMSLVLITTSTVTARSDVPSRIPHYILNAANTYDIDVTLMYAICMVESRCHARAVNHNDGNKRDKALGIVKKSFGMYQIQLETAQFLGFEATTTITTTKKRGHKTIVITKEIDNSKELLKPDVNAMYAAKLLKHLYNKYHDTEKVISAYNAGRYTKANQDYVGKVFRVYVKYHLDKRF